MSNDDHKNASSMNGADPAIVTVSAGGTGFSNLINNDFDLKNFGGKVVDTSVEIQKGAWVGQVAAGAIAPAIASSGPLTQGAPSVIGQASLGRVASRRGDPDQLSVSGLGYIGAGVGYNQPILQSSIASAKSGIVGDLAEGLKSQQRASAAAITRAIEDFPARSPAEQASLLASIANPQLRAQLGELTKLPAAQQRAFIAKNPDLVAQLTSSLTPSIEQLAATANLPTPQKARELLDVATETNPGPYFFAEAKAQGIVNVPVGRLQAQLQGNAAMEIGQHTDARSYGGGLTIGRGIDSLPTPLPRANPEAPELMYVPTPRSDVSSLRWSVAGIFTHYDIDQNRFAPAFLTNPSVNEFSARASVALNHAVTAFASYRIYDNPIAGDAITQYVPGGSLAAKHQSSANFGVTVKLGK